MPHQPSYDVWNPSSPPGSLGLIIDKVKGTGVRPRGLEFADFNDMIPFDYHSTGAEILEHIQKRIYEAQACLGIAVCSLMVKETQVWQTPASRTYSIEQVEHWQGVVNRLKALLEESRLLIGGSGNEAMEDGGSLPRSPDTSDSEDGQLSLRPAEMLLERLNRSLDNSNWSEQATVGTKEDSGDGQLSPTPTEKLFERSDTQDSSNCSEQATAGSQAYGTPEHKTMPLNKSQRLTPFFENQPYGQKKPKNGEVYEMDDLFEGYFGPKQTLREVELVHQYKQFRTENRLLRAQNLSKAEQQRRHRRARARLARFSAEVRVGLNLLEKNLSQTASAIKSDLRTCSEELFARVDRMRGDLEELLPAQLEDAAQAQAEPAQDADKGDGDAEGSETAEEPASPASSVTMEADDVTCPVVWSPAALGTLLDLDTQRCVDNVA